MVSGVRRSRQGKSSLGCLISLALFVGALYYGERLGQVYVRYFRLRDAMRAQAVMAPSFGDDVISRRLTAESSSLFDGRRFRFRIQRGGMPSRITIQTEYTESVALPFFTYTLVLRPKVEERL